MICDDEQCYICGRWQDLQIHHCLHGSMRKLADEDGLTVYLCVRCHKELHDHGTHDKDLQRLAQYFYELTHTRAEFMKRYGKSYL